MVVAAASAMVCQFSSIKRFSAQRSGSSGSPGFLLLFMWFTSLCAPRSCGILGRKGDAEMPETKFRCPYCGVEFIEKSDNTKLRTIDFGRDADELAVTGYIWLNHGIQARYHCCPACEGYSVQITGFDNAFSLTYPPYTGIVLPDYIPEPIKTDYLEACAILDASPRAAATLARRCLQGMIRDYWRVKAGNLASEIDLIKDKISVDEYRVLNGIRRLGNIGAHMEKDVNLIVDIDPGEAQKLVKVLELLLKDQIYKIGRAHV